MPKKPPPLPKANRILLRGGALTSDPKLDRIYKQDLRSLNFLSGPTSGEPARRPGSYTWPLDVFLDQGQEGSCVGHGYAHELAASPVRVGGVTHEYAVQDIYWPAQREDDMPGGSYPGATPQYEGTSVLAGAKVLTEMGYYTAYRWGLTAIDVADSIRHDGPAVLGINWYNAMFTPSLDGFIHPIGTLAGGHCILAVGVKIAWKNWYNRFVSQTWDNVDKSKSYVILHNSWGKTWGQGGRAKLTLDDLDTLMTQQGEACFPVRSQRNVLVYPKA